MMRESQEDTITHRGVLATLAAGFELATAHWWLALLPALLDVFYWLGPRLSSRPLILRLVGFLQQEEMMAEIADTLADIAAQTNLFTGLSVPLLGVPGLLAGFVAPEETPLAPAVVEIGNPLSWLLLFLALTAVGLLVATVYYGLMAQSVRAGVGAPISIGRFLRWLPAYALRVFLLAATFLFAALAIYIPISLGATAVALLSPAIASLVLTFGIVAILWLFFYLSFSLHGVLLNDRPVFWSLFESLRLVQSNSLQVLLLLLLVLGIREGLSWLWLWAGTGGWFTIVSIIGHAFITTGLLTATFIYYRERYQSLTEDPDGKIQSKA